MKILLINFNLLEKFGEEYYAHESWFRIPINLATQAEQVTLLASVKAHEEGAEMPSPDQWYLEKGNLRIEDFDPCFSFISYYKRWFLRVFVWKKQIDKLIQEHDVVILRASSPNIFMVTSSAMSHKKPLVLIFPGNLETSSSRILGNQGFKRLLYLGLSKLILFQENRCARHAKLIYIYTKKLLGRFENKNPRVKLTRSPQVCLKDFVDRKDTCQSTEIRLLRVGWLSPTKGLEYLFEAVALLHSKGLKVRLEVAGKEGQTSGYKSHLEQLTEKLKIKEIVNFIGWIPYDRIEEIYTRNDIQVISSLSEGVPRCIAEGSARGLPLVSTTAGGCGEVLAHEKDALLVPPGDSKALAVAIERLVQDGELRRNLIKEGYKVAQNASFEVLGKQFLDEIQDVICTS